MRKRQGRPIPWRRTARELGDELEQEIAFHVEERAAALERRGYPPAEARAEALRRFGDFEETRRVCREADIRRVRREASRERAGEVLEDARLGVRQLLRRPAFAVVAVLTLGIGIGANAAIFAAVDHVLLRPLPFAGAERVVTLWETDERTADRKKELSPGNFLDVRERATSFAAIALAEPYAFDVLGDGPPESVPAWLVTEGWFEALGARPSLGRVFGPDDHASAAPQVAIISEGLWQRRYGGDSAIIGREIRLDEGTARIVGVLPSSAMYPDARDLWVPKVFQPREANDRRSAYMPAVARLAPGAYPARAQRELDGIAASLATDHPTTNSSTGFNVVPLGEHLLGPVRPALGVLLAAVALLLLIACTNLASLLLARGAERQQELSVRAALGAGRARLVRQLATENAVLTALGGAAGLLFARIGTALLATHAPSEIPRLDAMALDARVVAFLLVVTILSGILFGAMPALRFSRPDLMHPLRGGRAGVMRERHLLRSGLVTAEIALALMLLVGAGLLGHSFLRLTANDTGFATEHRSYVQAFVWDRNPTPEERIVLVSRMEEQLAATQGVHSVGAVSALPFHPHAITAQGGLRLDDRPESGGAELPRVHTTVATPGYFDVLSIPLVRGRGFTEHDRAGAPMVALVNEALVREHYGGEDPVGRRISIGVMGAPVSREIVGVVRDVRPSTLDASARPEVYVPHAQHGSGSMTFVVRGARGVVPMTELQASIWRVDPQQTTYSSGTMASLIAATVAERRFHLLVVGLISTLAFALAAMGVYGLISFRARLRTHEIGVRMALGARSREIVMLVVRQSLALTLPGIIIGLAGAALFSRMLGRMLYETSPVQLSVYAQLTLVVLAMAALAAWLPARRSLKEDPLRALRSD